LQKRSGFENVAVALVILTVTLSASVGIVFFLTNGLQAASNSQTTTTAYYTINGLTCADPSDTPNTVTALVSAITSSQRFLAATNGSQFVLGNYESITDRETTSGGKFFSGPDQNGTLVGGTVINLPDVLELVFYGYGPSTTCARPGGHTAFLALDVQVPIQNGVYNMTGMQIVTARGPD
jgi:hypothetical protein